MEFLKGMRKTERLELKDLSLIHIWPASSQLGRLATMAPTTVSGVGSVSYTHLFGVAGPAGFCA